MTKELTITFQGNPLTLSGAPPTEGTTAPHFSVLDNELNVVTDDVLEEKTTIILTVPSLDTPVCDTEVRTFNTKAVELGDNVQVLCISMDLPFAQARWCGAHGIENVLSLSDHLSASFAGWGVLIEELRLLTRTVFVIDKTKTIRYSQIVPEITDEPDYDAALAAVKNVLI
jgi:thioredoxin-dependent peroxiredoxin